MQEGGKLSEYSYWVWGTVVLGNRMPVARSCKLSDMGMF